jgi:hypothetical protein
MAQSFIQNSDSGTVMMQDLDSAAFIQLDPELGLTDGVMLMTSFNIQRGQMTQYQKVFSNKILAYAFGEAPGTVTVGGYVFLNNTCKGDTPPVQALNDYYTDNNIYQGIVVTVSVGQAVFKGYLEAFSVVAENNQFNFGSFSMVIKTLPEE